MTSIHNNHKIIIVNSVWVCSIKVSSNIKYRSIFSPRSPIELKTSKDPIYLTLYRYLKKCCVSVKNQSQISGSAQYMEHSSIFSLRSSIGNLYEISSNIKYSSIFLLQNPIDSQPRLIEGWRKT